MEVGRQENNWQSAGAQGSLDRGSTVLGTVTATATGVRNIVLNAAGLAVVQGWIDNPATNFGFILQDYANSNKDDLVFSSKEATNAANRPQLQFVYIPPSAAQQSLSQGAMLEVRSAKLASSTSTVTTRESWPMASSQLPTAAVPANFLELAFASFRVNSGAKQLVSAVASGKNDHRSNDRYDAAADVVLMALGNQLGNPFKFLS